MSPQRLFAALCAALLAGSALIFVSFGLLDRTSEQRVDASDGDAQPLTGDAFGDMPVVALSDTENRTILDLSGSTPPNNGDTANRNANVLTVDVGEAPSPAGPATSVAVTETTSEAAADTTTTSVAPTTAAPDTAARYDSSAAPGASVTSASTTAAPTTAEPTTEAPTTAAPTSAAPTSAPATTSKATTTESTAPWPQVASTPSELDSIRNKDPRFSRFASTPSAELPLGQLLASSPKQDNGSHPDGTFRMACNYSHFAYDDPIVKPGQPGASHLHMFFGNTAVDANTTTESLVNSGGGSCQGFELNRSGYWTPAVLDGRGNVVVPDQIILYYKSKKEHLIKPMPQGLKMVVGNTNRESFDVNDRLGWSCGGSGTSYNKSNRIPNNCGGDPVNFYVQFPQCWDGKNLDSHDHISHMYFIAEEQSCPSSHPVRLPQISILAYFPPSNTSGWHLSSDRTGGFNTGPGATLHADWFGGWNEEALNLWLNNCMKASRNCSEGQTGTSRQFASLGNGNLYTGPNLLPLP